MQSDDRAALEKVMVCMDKLRLSTSRAERDALLDLLRSALSLPDAAQVKAQARREAIEECAQIADAEARAWSKTIQTHAAKQEPDHIAWTDHDRVRRIQDCALGGGAAQIVADKIRAIATNDLQPPQDRKTQEPRPMECSDPRANAGEEGARGVPVPGVPLTDDGGQGTANLQALSEARAPLSAFTRSVIARAREARYLLSKNDQRALAVAVERMERALAALERHGAIKGPATLSRRSAEFMAGFRTALALRGEDLEPPKGPREEMSHQDKAYLRHVERRLAEVLAAQPAARGETIDRRRFERAPCYICGYNGPGYFHRDTHACAVQYHDGPAARGEQYEKPASLATDEALAPKDGSAGGSAHVRPDHRDAAPEAVGSERLTRGSPASLDDADELRATAEMHRPVGLVLSDAEVLERAAAIYADGWPDDDGGLVSRQLRTAAKILRQPPAPEPDVFAAFAHDVLNEGDTTSASYVERCARERFGPAVKALELVERASIDPGSRIVAGSALAQLRARAKEASRG